MSAYSMADGLFRPREDRDRVNSGDDKVADALRRLAEYIPAEGLGIYITGVALVAVRTIVAEGVEQVVIDTVSAAVVLLIAALFNALVIWKRWADARKASGDKNKPTKGALWFGIGLATVLLAIYVSTLPGNPITGRWQIAMLWAGFAAVVAAGAVTVWGDELKNWVGTWGQGKPPRVLAQSDHGTVPEPQPPTETRRSLAGRAEQEQAAKPPASPAT